MSATTNPVTMDVQPGDFVVFVHGVGDDAPNFTGTYSIAGATLTQTPLAKVPTTLGNDGAMWIVVAEVTAGTVTAAPSFVGTSSVSGRSDTALVSLRIREVGGGGGPTLPPIIVLAPRR